MSIGGHVETTSDERVMAALAHFFGLIAAIIVWATQKDKSRFVRFQALQALAFDVVFMVVYMLGFTCFMGLMLLGMIALVGTTADSSPSDPVYPGMVLGMLMPFGVFACVMPFALGAFAARVIAAVSVATGHNFRYPLIASRVDALLKEPAAPVAG